MVVIWREAKSKVAIPERHKNGFGFLALRLLCWVVYWKIISEKKHPYSAIVAVLLIFFLEQSAPESPDSATDQRRKRKHWFWEVASGA